eukprot:c20302_g3_i1 orf=199-1104(-)
MLTGRSSCSAPCPPLPRTPPQNLSSSSSSSRSGCRLRLQTQSLGRWKGHDLLMLAPRPRGQGHRHRPTFALLTQVSIQDLTNNQVLWASVTAGLTGQLFKPLTAALQGKGFNWRLLVASGGMPSTHSAWVTAACTSIALERGLADSLFGLSVVFASIVMYDAQGVRRTVGKQAEVINTMVVGSGSKPLTTVYKGSFATNRQASAMATDAHEQNCSDDKLFRGGSYNRSQNFIETAKKLPAVEAGEVNLQEIGDMDGWRHLPLKESVGHTKLEVAVGGLWGILTTLALSYFTEFASIQTLHT